MKSFSLWIAVMIFALLMVACAPEMSVSGSSASSTGTSTSTSANTPTRISTVTQQVDYMATISVLETRVAQNSCPTSTNTPTPTATFTPTPTATLTPTPTATPVLNACNQAELVADVTIPDGSPIDAGLTFTKTWRLRNIGTCTWSAGYKVVFVGGYQMGGLSSIYLGTSVAPGQTIDISMNLTAPNEPGAYKGSYKLADASGAIFGIGPAAKGAFFVLIQRGSLLNLKSGTGQVSLSTTRAQAGDLVTVYVKGFPANSQIDYRMGIQGDDPSVIYDGAVGADGTTSKTLEIPGDAVFGEYWVVKVLTTSQVNGIIVTSNRIYIGANYSNPPYTGNAQVNLSKIQAAIGNQVTVYVTGFPVNTKIDYRIGLQGQTASIVYDGAVGSGGATSQTFTIPTSAKAGEYWVVKVLTTNLQNGITITSHSIYITN